MYGGANLDSGLRTTFSLIFWLGADGFGEGMSGTLPLDTESERTQLLNGEDKLNSNV